MRAFLCVLLVSVGGVCGGADRPDQHPLLLGNWKVAAVFRDGAALRNNGGWTGIQFFPNNKIVFGHVAFDVRTLTYRTDPSRYPRRLDVYDEKRTTLIKTGIYGFNNGVLWFCQGDPRPTEFETKPGDGRMLFVLSREGKKRPIGDPPRRPRPRRVPIHGPPLALTR